MRLDTEFIRLPYRFDAARLAAEIAQIPESGWRPHPQGMPGNSALPLISLNGDPMNDGVKGPMRPTPALARLPYVRQVMASLKVPLGRSRLMRLVGEAEATAHVDINYYWMRRTRIHVPVVTTPDVRFHCGEHAINMPAGECWIFDTWRTHRVLNPAPTTRIHLVIDTVGTAEFWDMARHAERPFGPQPARQMPDRMITFDPGLEHTLAFESENFPVVMSPQEQADLLGQLVDELRLVTGQDQMRVQTLGKRLDRFRAAWSDVWAAHANRATGWAEYQQLLDALRRDLPLAEGLQTPNKSAATDFLAHAILDAALNTALAPAYAANAKQEVTEQQARFHRPVFIVSAPRSGSSLLFETLALSPDFWTIGGESHEIFERLDALNPAMRDFESNRLTAQEAKPNVATLLRDGFISRLRNRDNRYLPASNDPFRMLEKTPKNALRIPFLNAVFPDALFIYLHREPRDNLSSMLDAWRSRRFVTYPQLPGWDSERPWSLLLTPAWRALKDRPLPEVVAAQWQATQESLLADLQQLQPERWCTVRYEELLADPQATVEKLCAFCGVGWDVAVEAGQLPHAQHTLTPPGPEKWKANAAELEQMLPRVEATAQAIKVLVDTHGVAHKVTGEALKALHATPKVRKAVTPVPKPEEAQKLEFGSEFTNNLAEILRQLKISLVVTTYQAGKMIFIREDGGKMNTHFRLFDKPMGMIATPQKLAVGTTHSIHVFHNMPDVARKLDPPGKHDACYVPRDVHVTGDIDIHEMAWGRDEQLWFINTRFSSLCTYDSQHSFVPRWRPRFVTALSPEDRCHLNGLCMINGKPRYVTALGETDSHEAWRSNKAAGGILIDVDSDRIIARGLSMPHSPRWHNDRLYVLESGKGSLGILDFASGHILKVAELPGFTRGIDFYGNYAFIGLSQVRESAAFSGIPITQRTQERNCGIWIVDINTGRTVGFLRFKGAVQEIFSVSVLPNVCFPELLDHGDPMVASSYVLPDKALKDVPKALAG